MPYVGEGGVRAGAGGCGATVGRFWGEGTTNDDLENEMEPENEAPEFEGDWISKAVVKLLLAIFR